ncbi:MAG TPA: type II pantothenate kinase [Prevotella sp.]|nr:type II pantothenate kinase [Prevotella sp.]
MNISIGIDVGISTTKIVGISNGKVISPVWIKATDPVTSLYGAFGKFLHDNSISLNEVGRVMLTGVGAAYIDGPIYGLPTHRVDEFVADGLGAAFVSGINRMIVVSMGTGTSLVSYDNGDIRHIGGIGIGGGTLNGLSRLLLQTDNIMQITEMALSGDVANINLSIGDISARPLPGLPMDATASLFANAQGNARQEDIAKGLICMVLQAIGSATILSSINSDIRDYVLIGNLSRLPQCKEIYPKLDKLYNVRFVIPERSEFCTAIGAALDNPAAQQQPNT